MLADDHFATIVAAVEEARDPAQRSPRVVTAISPSLVASCLLPMEPSIWLSQHEREQFS